MRKLINVVLVCASVTSFIGCGNSSNGEFQLLTQTGDILVDQPAGGKPQNAVQELSVKNSDVDGLKEVSTLGKGSEGGSLSGTWRFVEAVCYNTDKNLQQLAIAGSTTPTTGTVTTGTSNPSGTNSITNGRGYVATQVVLPGMTSMTFTFAGNRFTAAMVQNSCNMTLDLNATYPSTDKVTLTGGLAPTYGSGCSQSGSTSGNSLTTFFSRTFEYSISSNLLLIYSDNYSSVCKKNGIDGRDVLLFRK